ncbi:MAG TPA: LysR family transcriptional regulator [Deltaproteobacteria bacterium]|nr:MAG: hypothetical protein AUK23_07345 [Deltaproteobacteria bacterium CG2_30_43_15]PIU86558.1 MAG: LysR family transcriptional regulator [Deltaproteobacteria bacterium CG06_land_8_20_14_3_00_44_19]PIZ19148.1 MAG: LysR family transcriptional regulator [Deltaproteobacteria bacterium CG_4_10_14_0_8_um_filter_43_12]HCX88914.1 LysR family transcriptional regulator [Deltaproteobacteria bacterium]
MDFDLRHLEILCKVIELKSFLKAADAVCLAQASVSERIANLETIIGTRLLDRLGRQVVPTRAGELLYKHATKLLEMKRTACLEMQDFLGIKRGEIHIGGSTVPGEFILPKVIARFNAEYPSVLITLTISDTREIETRVLHGDFDLGVVGSKSSHNSIVSHELWNDELVLVVSPHHRWANKGKITIEELSGEPFILREVGSGTLKSMEDYLRESVSNGIDSLNVVARFGTTTAVKEGIKAGLGLSILSSRVLETELKAKVLKTLQLKGIPMFRSFYLIRNKRRVASPMCQAMLDFLLTASEENQKKDTDS